MTGAATTTKRGGVLDEFVPLWRAGQARGVDPGRLEEMELPQVAVLLGLDDATPTATGGSAGGGPAPLDDTELLRRRVEAAARGETYEHPAAAAPPAELLRRGRVG